ncbi:hypothetical protein SAMN06893096_102521 [Geodermatophilus pulveris]|uniref:Dyp-type peroxidase family n=1 Tax=Geodermatophilus pulveris TaxID=1564159 RepID=A0A239CMZ6_9ACTN|nr:hypothetical protein [Geodermatophilus pulveris]SNS21098.1 hypothetical protein SAMN06893096_102521 [Geodermatophilus pulveris]
MPETPGRTTPLAVRLANNAALLRLAGRLLSSFLPVLAVGRVVLVSRHADVVDVLERDGESTIAEVNAVTMDRVNGPFVLGMDRSERYARERSILEHCVHPGDPARGLEIANLHRIVRRGRAYGGGLPEDAVEDDGVERGLFLLCLDATIERQFEFVQRTWLDNVTFAGLYEEQDAVMGTPPDGGGLFTVEGTPLATRLRGVPDFVRVRGGAYFSLPGIRGLRALAGPGRTGPRGVAQRGDLRMKQVGRSPTSGAKATTSHPSAPSRSRAARRSAVRNCSPAAVAATHCAPRVPGQPGCRRVSDAYDHVGMPGSSTSTSSGVRMTAPGGRPQSSDSARRTRPRPRRIPWRTARQPSGSR